MATNYSSRPNDPSPDRHDLEESTTRSISRPLHGILDYVMGLLICTSPWLFGFTDQQLAPQIALTLGIALIFISLVTNYEAGLVPLLPFAAHRFTDFAIGIALVGSPWLFSTGGRVGAVFVILGALHLFMAGMTRRPQENGTFL